MKKLLKKTKGLVKGASTAALLSAAIHIILLLVASTVVVFSIIQHNEAKFVPVKIDRPKMDLKKLRIKVKDSSKPRQTTERIVSTRKSASMPEISVPKMTGMGSGLGKGIGGFQMMADISSMTLFGGSRSIGNDLEGTLYDLKRDRAGNFISDMQPTTAENRGFALAVNKFLASDWDKKVFDPYFRSPRKLYAIHLMLPPFGSPLALEKFGLEEGIEAGCFLIHYKGRIAYPKGGKFRFWGNGDDMLYVRINRKLVLDGRTRDFWNELLKTPDNWTSSDPENRKYFMGMGYAWIGDWFELEPGVPVEMEVLMGEDIGGRTSAMINVQEFGVEYPKNQNGMPILPAFKTAPIPQHIVDEINYSLIPGESDLTGGPIFSAY
jgi:hypothetical protein